MILLDLSGTMIANIMVHLNQNGNQLTESTVRHMVLNSIRSYIHKFYRDYGELVVCCDDSENWRREWFPYYKASRRKGRDKDKYDWKLIYESLHKIREELKEFFPYKVIQIPYAEADDIIGAICHKYGTQLGGDPILILSTDKDLVQLQCYANVAQWNPRDKRWVRTDDPEKLLQEHIIRGDSGDGVPNFLSKDDVFVDPDARQSPIMKKKLQEWLKIGDPEKFCDERTLRNYRRNEKLIDLSNTPNYIYDQAIEEYENQPSGDRSKLFKYFIHNRLKYLIEHITEF